MPVISIIVPVYRVEPYLRRCIDSVLSQSFTDFELILIDDGSPDNCPVICDEYAAADPRVRVIHQKNQGLSAARNAALDDIQARNASSWLTFIDSDDWVHPQMLELLHDAVLRHGTKIAICAHQKANGHVTFEQYPQSNAVLWDAEEYYVTHNLNATIACAKLYHASCFDQLRFPIGKVHEDEYTTYKILFHHKDIAVTDLPLYVYYFNPQSITTSGNKLKWLHALSAFEEQLDFFKRTNAQKAYSYRIANYYIELVLFPKQLSFSNPEERDAKRTLANRRKSIRAQMNSTEKRIAYQYLYPRTTNLFLRIIRCTELLKNGGVSSLIAAFRHRGS